MKDLKIILERILKLENKISEMQRKIDNLEELTDDIKRYIY